MTMPTSASVTEIACTCGYLERSSLDPDTPIEFDPLTNEFSFTWPWKGGDGSHSLVIYHCPRCGGAAPKSRRDSLFAYVTLDEARRLDEIFAGVRTLEDAITKCGPPDEDYPNGVRMHTPEKDGKPPKVRSFRTIRYSRLSETADVHLTDYQRDRVEIHYEGKHLSKPDSR